MLKTYQSTMGIALGLTSTRWKLVWLLVLISVVRSMDAVNFSVAAQQIMPEFGITAVQIGTLYSAYLLGYAVFHLPGGWLADTVGAKKLVGLALVWWSLLTALTALAPDLPALAFLGPFTIFLLVRFLIGLAEGACYPGSVAMLSRWMPVDERGAAGGLIVSGMGIGYAITPPIVAFIMVQYGWRVAFYAFSVIGLLTAVRWFTYATNTPKEHTKVSPEELRRIEGECQKDAQSDGAGGVPWRLLLGSSNIWLMGFAGFCTGYGIYLYQAWFYLYLVNERGFDLVAGGLATTAPFIAVAIMSPLGGKFSDFLVTRHGVKWGRRATASAAMLLSTLCIAIGAGTEQSFIAIALLALGDGFLYVAAGCLMATTIDIGGRHSGTTYAMCNLLTILGGAIAASLTAVIATNVSWEAAIYTMGGVTLLGAVAWLKVDAGRPLIEKTQGNIKC